MAKHHRALAQKNERSVVAAEGRSGRSGSIALSLHASFEARPDSIMERLCFVSQRNSSSGIAMGLQLSGARIAGAQMIFDDISIIRAKPIECGERLQGLYFSMVHR
jgi:hypothetical protein